MPLLSGLDFQAQRIVDPLAGRQPADHGSTQYGDELLGTAQPLVKHFCNDRRAAAQNKSGENAGHDVHHA